MQLEGATVFITGANGGIGQQFIQALLAAGVAKLYAAARRLEALAEVTALDPERVIPIALDVTQPEAVATAAEQCSDVTLLINNAGVSRDVGLIAADSLTAARLEMETNYFGMLSMCRAFAPILRANGGGAILNMLSLVSKVNLPFMGSYCASKAACLSLTQGVRAELRAQGTLVVGVMPGTVDTPFAVHYPPPKVAPEEVVRQALAAVESETEDVYPGDQATDMVTQLQIEPKAVEQQVASLLPALYPFV
ncbi:MAG: SDR family oxidoreductase [Synechococcaceae cyanobacterium SM2_3_60]|nr:SDR family oxidoreductase [Synechococcaceae cyanobacterium SM2_3_60]